MEPITLKALKTFAGIEGKIEKDQVFIAASELRAKQLEDLGFAERTQEEPGDDTPVLSPLKEEQDPPENTKVYISPQDVKEAQRIFGSLTLAELTERAKEAKITGYSSMRKDALRNTLYTTLKSKGEI